MVVRWSGHAWEDINNFTRRVSFYSLLPIRPVPRVTVTAQIPEHKREAFAEFVKGLGGEVRQ